MMTKQMGIEGLSGGLEIACSQGHRLLIVRRSGLCGRRESSLPPRWSFLGRRRSPLGARADDVESTLG
jgi:hypothetical protein